MKRKSFTKIYLHQIKTLFPIFGKKERQYLKGFEETVQDYADDHPIRSTGDLINEFGTPQEVVNSYIDQADVDYLSRKIKKNTFIKRIIFVVAFCFLIFLGFYAVLIYKDYLSAKNAHITKEEIIIEYEGPGNEE